MLPYVEWCENSALGLAIRDSLWLFPVIEACHLVGLAILGGTVLVVDLRLMGLGLRQQPVARLIRDVQPWFFRALTVTFASGVLLFMSEAIKCYYSSAFRAKVMCLGVALVLTFVVRRSLARLDDNAREPEWQWLAGAMSMLVWLGVGASGRWIGFS